MTDLGAGGVSTFPGATPGAPYPQYFGIFFGLVNNNADPLNQHRCLLQVPQLFGTGVTTWATCLTPLTNPPAVGTVITAMFIGGDVDHPCYLVTDPAMLALESNVANVQPVGTTAAAGNSTNAAAANHVHTLANALESTTGNITLVGAAAAAGVSPKAARGDHAHGVLDPLTVNDLTVTNDLAVNVLNVSGNMVCPAGFAINSEPTPTITSLPQDSNSGTTWVSGERAFMNTNWVNVVNANFANLISALQSAGILH